MNQSELEETAIINAAKHGHEEVLDLLLSRSPELHENSGSEDRTPLHFAAENGHDKIVEKLLAHSPGLISYFEDGTSLGDRAWP